MVLMVAILSHEGISSADDSDECCRQFTGNLCTPTKNMFQSVKNIEEEKCMKLCRDVYSGSETTDEFKCQYYEYDKFQKICHLFNTTKDFDLNSCQKIGGPSCPKYDQCVTWFTSKSTSQEQSCKFFRSKECPVPSALLDDFQDVLDTRSCQLSCYRSSLCKYFVYDTKTSACSLYRDEVLDMNSKCNWSTGTPRQNGTAECKVNKCKNCIKTNSAIGLSHSGLVWPIAALLAAIALR